MYINRSPFTGSPIAVHKNSNLDWGGTNVDGTKMHRHYLLELEIYYCDEVLFEVLDANGKILNYRYFYLDKDFTRYLNCGLKPRIPIYYYQELPCGDYTMKFTLKNKCDVNTTIYQENTKYRCNNI